MATEKKIYRVLVAGGGDRFYDSICTLLAENQYEVSYAGDAGETRRRLLSETADIVIICTPLPDEFGVDLALDLAETSMGILLIVKNELCEQIEYKVEDSGIMTLGKRMTRQEFQSAVKMLSVMSARLEKAEKKMQSLQKKMNDIRTVNHAKWLLIEKENMTEAEAHRSMEKLAMDMRCSLKHVADTVIEELEKI